MRNVFVLALVLLLLGGTRQILGAGLPTSASTPAASSPLKLTTLNQSKASASPEGVNKEALANDLKTALENFKSNDANARVPLSLPPALTPSLQQIKSAFHLKEKGFHFVRAEALSSSSNMFFVFYRHQDPEKGKELATTILEQLVATSFQAFPQNVTNRASFSPGSSVVLALNFLTSDQPYPVASETAVGSNIKSPFGFHNDVRGVSMKAGTASVHLQEYFVPLFDVLHWSAVTPTQVAELIRINNNLGSEGSLYASISESFGATMAFLAPYLKLTTAEFLEGTKKLLKALARSQSLSKSALNQELCPSPADYFVMAPGLRPTFHNVSGRNMAFLSHNFEDEVYVRWLVLSQLFSLAAKPLVIEDCGWPASLTDDFLKTVNAWWNQMTVIGADQKSFQQSKFLCEP